MKGPVVSYRWIDLTELLGFCLYSTEKHDIMRIRKPQAFRAGGRRLVSRTPAIMIYIERTQGSGECFNPSTAAVTERAMLKRLSVKRLSINKAMGGFP